MGWYRVTGPAPSRTPFIRILGGGLLALTFLIMSFRTFPTVRVTVNGERVPLRTGATAELAIRTSESTLPCGDILGAVDRSVVSTGRGELPRVIVNGEPADLETRVFDGDSITVRRGADRVESVVTTRVAIPIPVKVEGRGPLVQLAVPGAVGVREKRVGAVSGQVVGERVVRRPVAMVYRRLLPSGKGKLVALTFDDGPWPGSTERVLAVLRHERVPATFFMIGKHIRRWPDIARKVVKDGHVIGNHTETHLKLGQAKMHETTREIRTGQRTIEQLLGVEPGWFRPPGGQTNRNVYRATGKLGLRLALWNVDPQDWRRPSARVLEERVIDAIEPGSVVLLHDGGGDRRRTVWALRRIIKRLKARGYTFVTLDELPGRDWR